MLALPNRRKVVLGAGFLILLLASLFFRFSDLGASALNADEITNATAAIKLNTPNQPYDARWYNYEHPFLGKKLMGLLIDPRPYEDTSRIPANLLVYNYLGVPEYRDEVLRMKLMAALFGALFLIPVFFLGRLLFGSDVGMVAAALVGVSVGFINMSRVLFQDAFLPFFFAGTLYFALAHVKESPSTSFGPFRRRDLFFVLTLVFLGLSGLVRTGQPLLLAGGLLLGLVVAREKIGKWVAGILLVAGGIIFLYPYIGFTNLLRLHHEALFQGALNENVFASFLSQNGWGVIVLLAASGYFFLHSLFTKKTSLPAWVRAWKPEHQVALLVTAVGVVSSMFWVSQEPRLYLVFFILPLVYLAAFACRKTGKPTKVLIALAIGADILLLFSVAPFFLGYTPGGIEPIYMHDITPELGSVEKIVDGGPGSYFTNDERLLADDARAEVIPPYHNAYLAANACNQAFDSDHAGMLFLYHKTAFSLNENSYLCRFITSLKNVSTLLPVPLRGEYDLYQIQP